MVFRVPDGIAGHCGEGSCKPLCPWSYHICRRPQPGQEGATPGSIHPGSSAYSSQLCSHAAHSSRGPHEPFPLACLRAPGPSSCSSENSLQCAAGTLYCVDTGSCQVCAGHDLTSPGGRNRSRASGPSLALALNKMLTIPSSPLAISLAGCAILFQTHDSWAESSGTCPELTRQQDGAVLQASGVFLGLGGCSLEGVAPVGRGEATAGGRPCQKEKMFFLPSLFLK